VQQLQGLEMDAIYRIREGQDQAERLPARSFALPDPMAMEATEGMEMGGADDDGQVP
jgi:hypothetical protein